MAIGLAPYDDGLKIRVINVWTLDKLEIVRRYLHQFSKICAPRFPFYLVDGFAGDGLNRVKGTKDIVWGTPLIGLTNQPPFTKSLFMDKGKKNLAALRRRTEHFTNVDIKRGDTNTDLVPFMREHLTPWWPGVVLLDPEGSELAWTTVQDVSKFRTGSRKVEQLILLATHTGFTRGLFVEDAPPRWAGDMMNRIYGNDLWTSIYERRLNHDITPAEATKEYVELYGHGLRYELGYKWALSRPIRAKGFDGKLLYFLMFATDDEVGHRIMDHIFRNVIGERPAPPTEEIAQGSLFDL